MVRDGRWRRPAQPRDADEEEMIGVWRRIDARVLDAMGLPEDASDVDVLDRMLEARPSR